MEIDIVPFVLDFDQFLQQHVSPVIVALVKKDVHLLIGQG
jgi:hypothetical protein